MTAGLVEEMQAYYSKRASMYDRSMGYDSPRTVESLQPVVESLRRQLNGRTLLEIACGPGFWTRFVSQVATAITATDYNASVLAEAREKVFDRNNVTLLLADAYNLSSLSGTFDGAFAVDWLAHVPKSRLNDFVDGLHRRVQPGARVVFCDQLPGAHSWTGVHDHEGNHVQERMLPDGSRYQVIKHFFSDGEWRERFARDAEELTIERFPACRRVVVGYTLATR